jgi:spermidine/putrescine transport system permease protein
VKVLAFLQRQVSPRINVIGTFVFLASITLVIVAQALLMKRGNPPSSINNGARQS